MTSNDRAGLSPFDAMFTEPGHEPANATTTVTEEELAADDELDEFGEPGPPRRIPRLTLLLGLALVLAITFTGGVLVQKHYGGESASAISLPTGFAAALGGSGTGGGSSADGADASAPAVIGTVVTVNGTDLTVQDLGGTKHVIHTTKTTTVTRSSTLPLTGLKAGNTVRVDGTSATDGTVTATTVTAR